MKQRELTRQERGAIRSLVVEEDGITRYAQVEPAADLSGLRYVYVIVDYNE